MPGFRDRKTPGVYITEIPAFPPSAVGVDTAIPAFVGYTERAWFAGKPVFNTPIPVASIDEYHTFFGAGPKSIFKFDPGTERDYDVSFADIDPTGKAAEGGPSLRKLVRTGQVGALYHSLSLFYANGGSRCYVVSVGTYGEAIDSKLLQAGVVALEDQAGPTMLLVPDLSLLPQEAETWAVPGFKDVAGTMLTQCQKKQDRVALLDVVHAQRINRTSSSKDLADAILQFRADVDHEYRNYGAAYFPHLNTSIVRGTDLDYTWFEPSGLQDFVLNDARTLFPNPEDDAVKAAIVAVKQDFTDQSKVEPSKPVLDALDSLKTTNEPAAQKLSFLYNSFYQPVSVKTRDQNLTNAFPALKDLYNSAARVLNRLPASAAMAGVITFTDTARGVWNAPANVALAATLSPGIIINDDVQGDLNKPLDGKAVNVIREFIGRGPVIWGARTLDGNSNDYRYLQVRRTLIYIEQSAKIAMAPFVFAPNDGSTWVNTVAMISNFLQDLWAKGGLMGASPQEAFSVECGLGTTMTARDVLEGYMIVKVLLQMIHPAEFIELTFKQKMGTAG